MNILDAIVDDIDTKAHLDREMDKQSYLTVRDGGGRRSKTSVARYNKRRMKIRVASGRRKAREVQTRTFRYSKMALSRVEALLFRGGLIPDANGAFTTASDSENRYAHRLLIERFGSVESALQVRTLLQKQVSA